MRSITTLLCLVPLLADETRRVDVLVYAANSAGVGAAVTASDGGLHSVQVMEPLRIIGGMGAAGGVALMNQGCGLGGVTGLAKNWSRLCAEFYGVPDQTMTFPSMNVSEWAFWQLLESSPAISTEVGCRPVAVAKNGASGCLSRVTFLCNDDQDTIVVEASYMVDASYDGELMVLAGGIDHRSGREPRSLYNESLAGAMYQDSAEESFDKQGLWIDPYFSNGTLLPYIDADPAPAPGAGDDRLMAYQYFACLSPTAGNQVKFWEPPGYNADDFTLLLRQIEAMLNTTKYHHGVPLNAFGDIQCYDPAVEAKTGNRDCLFCCGPGPVDADQPDLNRGFATANYSRRQQILQDHRYYLQGSLYFMATDPRVPAATRASVNAYGYCADEYAEHGHFPPQIYNRISNRLIGETLLTQNNIANPRIKPDGVSMGCWWFDQHTVSRHVVPDKRDPSGKTMVVENEGFFRNTVETIGSETHPVADCDSFDRGNVTGGMGWYDVPFGVMVPKRGQASNLLVPVAISATSVAYSTTRIENMFMDLGSAAGVAVAQLLARAAPVGPGQCPSIAVQDANVSAVQDVLSSKYLQRVHGPPGLPPGPPPAAYYLISGAGSAEWDGNFTRNVTLAEDGRAVFTNGESMDGIIRALYSYAGVWRLGRVNKEIYYVAGSPSSQPPLTGWLVAAGPGPHGNASLPAPTLTPSPR